MRIGQLKPRYYVSGSNITVTWRQAVKAAKARSELVGYAEIRQSIVAGYRKLAEFKDGKRVQP